MEAGVPERRQADQPPHPDDLVPPGDPPQRSDGEREHETGENGVAGDVLHELDLIAHDQAAQQRDTSSQASGSSAATYSAGFTTRVISWTRVTEGRSEVLGGDPCRCTTTATWSA